MPPFTKTGALIFVLAALLCPPARADGPTETDTASSEATVEGAEDILPRIREADAELAELSRDLTTAEGEDLAVLRNRLSELVRTQVEDLSTLLGGVKERRLTGADAVPLEPHVEALAGTTSRHLRSYVDRLTADLHDRSGQRPDLAPDAVQEFEQGMATDTARLDSLYMALIQLAAGMEGAGYPTQEEHDFMEERLEERGESLYETLGLASSQLDEIRERVGKAPEDQALQAELFAREERYDSNKSALLATVHMLHLLELDYVDLEVRTIELTGVVTPEALSSKVAQGLLRREVGRVETFMVERGPGLVVQALVVLIILGLSWLGARIARGITRRALDRRELSVSHLLRDMAVVLSGRVVLLLGVILVLSQLGVALGPLFAGLGIVGLVVGFALQDSLANFAAGGMILVYRPFDVGDTVEVTGVSGKVSDMNLVSTRVLTPDNQTLIVPNRKVWGDVIRNLTAEALRRVDLVFGISYEDDIPNAERVLTEVLASHAKVLSDPEPVVKLHVLGDSSVDFVARPWVRTEDYWDVYWDVTREIKMRFEAEGISIPYPQRSVHLVAEPE